MAMLALWAVVPTMTVGATDAERSITASAGVTAPAARGTQVQVTPLPPAPQCDRVAVVGDSLTAASAEGLRRELAAAGYDAMVDGQVSRRIPAAVRDPYSGVSATRRIRTTWGEADCWVIGLGSNDLEAGAADSTVAGRWIDEQLAAVTPGARVWWINVNYRFEAGNPFDFPAATATFNAVLDARASSNASLDVIDWYSVLAANTGWFVDGVHVRAPAYQERTRITLAALRR